MSADDVAAAVALSILYLRCRRGRASRRSKLSASFNSLSEMPFINGHVSVSGVGSFQFSI